MEMEDLLSAGRFVELLEDERPPPPCPRFTARATFCTEGMKRARSSGAMSNRLRAATLGMTSVWPSARGMMSKNARETSSS